MYNRSEDGSVCGSADTEPLPPGAGYFTKSADISYQTFFPLQVINAARILSSRPKSKVAQENMEVCAGLETCLQYILVTTLFLFQVFQTSWLAQAQILTDAVDDIVTVEDFLFVSESHILEDVNRSVLDGLYSQINLVLGASASTPR